MAQLLLYHGEDWRRHPEPGEARRRFQKQRGGEMRVFFTWKGGFKRRTLSTHFRGQRDRAPCKLRANARPFAPARPPNRTDLPLRMHASEVSQSWLDATPPGNDHAQVHTKPAPTSREWISTSLQDVARVQTMSASVPTLGTVPLLLPRPWRRPPLPSPTWAACRPSACAATPVQVAR